MILLRQGLYVEIYIRIKWMFVNQFYNIFFKKCKKLFLNLNEIWEYAYDPLNMNHIIHVWLQNTLQTKAYVYHILKSLWVFLSNNKPLNMSSVICMYLMHSWKCDHLFNWIVIYGSYLHSENAYSLFISPTYKIKAAYGVFSQNLTCYRCFFSLRYRKPH